MKRCLNSRTCVAIAGALIGLCLLWVVSWALHLTHEICNQGSEQNYGNCPRYNFALFLLWQIVEIANWLSPAVLALATGFLVWVTGRLVKLGREQSNTTRAQLRAYVLIDAIDLEQIAEGDTPEITIHLKNFGQTPAKNLRTAGTTSIMGYPLREWPKAEELATETSEIGPGGTYDIPLELEGRVTEEAIKRIRAGNAGIYALAQIGYDDVFDKHTDTVFRVMCVGARMYDTESMGPYVEKRTVPMRDGPWGETEDKAR